MARSGTSHNPFEGVTDYFTELGRMRELGTRGSEPGHETRERTHASAWVPATDIFVRDEELVIRVELGGVDPEDVDLSFSHGVLAVSGTRASEVDEDAVEFYVRERFYGAFRRTITLPEGTDREDISAEFDNGLVEVTVRTAARGDAHRIELAGKASPVRRKSVR